VDQYYIILDLKEGGWSNLSVSKYSQLIQALKVCHVDRLQKQFIINTSWFTENVLSMATKFIAKRTKKRLFYYSEGNNEYKDILKRVMPLDVIPVRYGGTNEMQIGPANFSKAGGKAGKKENKT
jgi:AAA15 family ATPase/GTPase